MAQRFVGLVMNPDGSNISISKRVQKESKDTGRSLLEYCLDSSGHYFANTVVAVLADKPHRVAWIGEQALQYIDTLPQEYGGGFITEEDRTIKLQFLCGMAWEHNAEVVSLTDDMLPLSIELSKYRYLVNETKKIYIDTRIYRQRNSMLPQLDYIHPLPLLTAVGNGANSGDYNTLTGIGGEDVGSWAFDVIYVSDTKPGPEYLCETNYVFSDGFVQPPNMRMITNEEWDRMRDLTGEDDALMHWDKIFAWVKDEANEYNLSGPHRVTRGSTSARVWSYGTASSRSSRSGFRPVIENLALDSLPPDSKDGDIVVVGTLYMNGRPVRVPQNPMWDGDIEDYVPGATLEMLPPLADPDYQVTGILDGGKVYCDRALLKSISYEDIESTCWKK